MGRLQFGGRTWGYPVAAWQINEVFGGRPVFHNKGCWQSIWGRPA